MLKAAKTIAIKYVYQVGTIGGVVATLTFPLVWYLFHALFAIPFFGYWETARWTLGVFFGFSALYAVYKYWHAYQFAKQYAQERGVTKDQVMRVMARYGFSTEWIQYLSREEFERLKDEDNYYREMEFEGRNDPYF